MIEPKEINKAAATNHVSDRQIEKDYVLSWMLFAISKNAALSAPAFHAVLRFLYYVL